MNQVQTHSLFTDFDIDLFKAGKHFRLYEKMGAHLIEVNGVKGVYFAVWAPSARSVSVVARCTVVWAASRAPRRWTVRPSGTWPATS